MSPKQEGAAPSTFALSHAHPTHTGAPLLAEGPRGAAPAPRAVGTGDGVRGAVLGQPGLPVNDADGESHDSGAQHPRKRGRPGGSGGSAQYAPAGRAHGDWARRSAARTNAGGTEGGQAAPRGPRGPGPAARDSTPASSSRPVARGRARLGSRSAGRRAASRLPGPPSGPEWCGPRGGASRRQARVGSGIAGEGAV